MTNVLRIASFTMICAIGECYLLIAGSWDISIGAVYSMGGVAAGLAMTNWGLPIWVSVILALVSGAVVGNGFEMIVIAGAVIGGISMSGGAGSIFGMALGAFFMAMITNGMTLIKISAYWQTMVTGALLIFACSLEYVRNRLKDSLNG